MRFSTDGVGTALLALYEGRFSRSPKPPTVVYCGPEAKVADAFTAQEKAAYILLQCFSIKLLKGEGDKVNIEVRLMDEKQREAEEIVLSARLRALGDALSSQREAAAKMLATYHALSTPDPYKPGLTVTDAVIPGGRSASLDSDAVSARRALQAEGKYTPRVGDFLMLRG